MSNLDLEQQEKILLCQSVRVMERPVFQSQAGACSKCDIRVWLAPSSVILMQKISGIKVLCEVCANEHIANADQPPMFGLAPGAVQEALRHLMKVKNN